MFQIFIDWIKSLFTKPIPQPAHDDPPVDIPIEPPPPAPLPVEPAATGYRLTTLNRWRSCHLVRTTLHAQMAEKAVSFKASFYDPVSQATGIPWYVVAALDMREESFIHSGYLGNGDPWNKVSVHVPRGRGPFTSWYAGAIDALKLDGLDKVAHWDIVTALICVESYNGSGYRARGIPSPYVWAGTNIYTTGKFVADGVFSATTVDQQPSCAGLFLALKLNHGVDLNEA